MTNEEKELYVVDKLIHYTDNKTRYCRWAIARDGDKFTLLYGKRSDDTSLQSNVSNFVLLDAPIPVHNSNDWVEKFDISFMFTGSFKGVLGCSLTLDNKDKCDFTWQSHLNQKASSGCKATYYYELYCNGYYTGWYAIQEYDPYHDCKRSYYAICEEPYRSIKCGGTSYAKDACIREYKKQEGYGTKQYFEAMLSFLDCAKPKLSNYCCLYLC